MNCKDRGWKEGEVFKVISNVMPCGGSSSYFREGEILVLKSDDGYSMSEFTSIDGVRVGEKYNVWLERVKRIWPPEKTVSIEIEGQKTEISIESARALKKMLEGV